MKASVILILCFVGLHGIEALRIEYNGPWTGGNNFMNQLFTRRKPRITYIRPFNFDPPTSAYQSYSIQNPFKFHGEAPPSTHSYEDDKGRWSRGPPRPSYHSTHTPYNPHTTTTSEISNAESQHLTVFSIKQIPQTSRFQPIHNFNKWEAQGPQQIPWSQGTPSLSYDSTAGWANPVSLAPEGGWIQVPAMSYGFIDTSKDHSSGHFYTPNVKPIEAHPPHIIKPSYPTLEPPYDKPEYKPYPILHDKPECIPPRVSNITLKELFNITRNRPNMDLPPGWMVKTADGTLVNIRDISLQLVPTPPPIIRIGIRERLTQNYSATYIERFEVSPLPSHGPVRPAYDIKKEIHYRGDPKPEYESISDLLKSKTKDKDYYSKRNKIHIFTQLIGTSNISAPLEGYNFNNLSPALDFNKALAERNDEFKNRINESPFLSQLKTLGEIFNQIQSVQRKAVPTFQQLHSGRYESRNNLWKIPAPILVYQVGRYTIGDPASSEKNILDAVYNFGLPAAQFEFGDLDLIKESWEEIQDNPEEINVNQLGTSGEEISDTFREWVKGYVRNGRTILAQSYNRVESKAFEGFKQYQFILTRDGECAVPLDPVFMGGKTSGACQNQGLSVVSPAPLIPFRRG